MHLLKELAVTQDMVGNIRVKMSLVCVSVYMQSTGSGTQPVSDQTDAAGLVQSTVRRLSSTTFFVKLVLIFVACF